MSIATYPSTPKPANSFVQSQKHRTLISDMESGAEIRRRQVRFPKRNVSLNYNYLSIDNRNTIQNFFSSRGGAYEEFWYVDWQDKKWVDEYIGAGGPFTMDGVLLSTASTSFTHYTVQANSTSTSDTYLTTTAPTTADFLYLISDNKYDTIAIDIGQIATAAHPITHEFYSATGGWKACIDSSDNTSGFHITGSNNITHTISTNWIDYTVHDINGFITRICLTTAPSAYSSTGNPKASTITVNTKTYDFHVVGATSPSASIYVNGTTTSAACTNWAFAASKGSANADIITFTSVPNSGDLMTCNITGKLRIKGRFEDELSEENPFVGRINLKVGISEIQW